MRKTTAIILSLFYVLISADASVAIHKCMGSIESIDFIQTAEVCCCGDMNMDDCCENETVDLPRDPEDKVISTYSFSFENTFFQLVELPSRLVLDNTHRKDTALRERDISPPLAIPVYIEYCSFTFYG